jgi:hypothetical protein
MAVILLLALPGGSAMAAERGDAAIGFSSGGVYYIPYGISGVEGTLDLEFGTHQIRDDVPVQYYNSLNKGGYVVNNQSGGSTGYMVVLSLSSFNNGLEGAALTLYPDERGLVSGVPGAQNPPIFLGNQGSVTLEADRLSTAVILEAHRHSEDPAHAALGRWGFNFRGNLQVYSHTILSGRSKAVMTWDIVLADF